MRLQGTMKPTLCKLVIGCCHPPNHDGRCEIDRPVPKGRGAAVDLEPVDSFLDQQQATAQLAARLTDELLIVVGSQSAMFRAGLTRDGLAILIHAKCPNAANGQPIPLSTVHKVLSAIESLGDFLKDQPEASHGKRR